MTGSNELEFMIYLYVYIVFARIWYRDVYTMYKRGFVLVSQSGHDPLWLPLCLWVAQPSGFTPGIMPEDYFIHFYRPDQWFDDVPTDVDVKEQDGDKVKRVLHTIAYNQGKETCVRWEPLELGTYRSKEWKKCLGCHWIICGSCFDFRIFRLVPDSRVWHCHVLGLLQ